MHSLKWASTLPTSLRFGRESDVRSIGGGAAEYHLQRSRPPEARHWLKGEGGRD